MTLRLDWNGPPRYILYIFIALVALIFVCYFFYWSQKFKRFSIFKKTNILAYLTEYEPDALRLYYDDKEIRDVSVTRIALWNSGTETIHSSEKPDDGMLSISIKDGSKISILDCSVEYVMNPGDYYKQDVFVSPKKIEDDRFILLFDQIKRNNGLILQVIHTGSARNLQLSFDIERGRATIEIDKKNTILRVNEKEPRVRTAWEKAMKRIGFRTETEFMWPIVMILEIAIFSILSWTVLFLDLPGAGLVISDILVFFFFLDIMWFIIYKLQIQNIPTELKKRL